MNGDDIYKEAQEERLKKYKKRFSTPKFEDQKTLLEGDDSE